MSAKRTLERQHRAVRQEERPTPRRPSPTPGSVSSAPPFQSAWLNENEEYEVPIRDAASSPRRQRRSEPSLLDIDDVGEHPTSLPDQIAASALAGTIEFLKLAGGITLNTTGKLVAPPLHVTRTLILPQLWHATVDILATTTPARLQNWFRILQSSLYHFVDVLKNTSMGRRFRLRLGMVGVDLVQGLASEPSRQVLIDGMSCLVKVAEALHTPEVENFLHQSAVLGCRFVEAAASPRNQQLAHDLAQLVWSACELVADPSTTLALAEVTAYLCYALEREDAALRPRRKERQDYQRQTYETTSLLRDPKVTVEEAILSSIGVAPTFGSHVPSSVVVDRAVDEGASTAMLDWEHASIRQQVQSQQSVVSSALNDDQTEQNVAEEEEDELHERARKDIDVPLLKKQIRQRRTVRAQAPLKRPDAVEIMRSPRPDAFDDDTDIEGVCLPPRKERIQLRGDETSTGKETNSEWVQLEHPLPLEGESTLQHFHRILDDTLTRKRKDAINEIIAEHKNDPKKLLQRRGTVKKRKTNFSGRSIREQLRALQSELDSQLKGTDKKKLSEMENVMRRNKNFVYLGLVLILLFVITWLGLGVYGLYVLVRPHRPAQTLAPSQSPAPSTPQPNPNEVLIRVVREVIHVDSKGKQLSSKRKQFADEAGADVFSKDHLERISQCVANNIP